MTTYTELVTQIRDYTETDSNVLSSTIINDFIEHTENRILRDLDIPIFTSHQYSNFTTSSGFLNPPPSVPSTTRPSTPALAAFIAPARFGTA